MTTTTNATEQTLTVHADIKQLPDSSSTIERSVQPYLTTDCADDEETDEDNVITDDACRQELEVCRSMLTISSSCLDEYPFVIIMHRLPLKRYLYQ